MVGPILDGASKSGWVKNLGDRAPELLAIIVIVALGLYHLGTVAAETNLVLRELTKETQASTVALTVLAEQARAEMGSRAKEHAELLRAIEREKR